MNDNSHRAWRAPAELPVGTVRATPNVSVLEQQIDEERIARRAYQIYESRHRADGHADEDWFQAASEYAARGQSEPTTFEYYGASSSFADRIRHARR